MAPNSTIIPMIDLQVQDSDRLIVQACKEWGCFRIQNFQSIMEESLVREMQAVASEILDLPHEVKVRIGDVITSTGYGYVPLSAANPMYESIGIFDDVASTDDVEAFCSLVEATPHQRETLLRYAKGVHKLMMAIMHKIRQGLGIITIDNSFKDWSCHSRINKYTFSPETVGSTAAHLHTDGGLFTIVHDDSIGGLEVMTKSGEFVAVDPCPGTFIVNIGDMGAVWSNGRFLNVKHRVMCKEPGIRVSIASALFGPKEGIIEAPDDLVDLKHPRLFQPFTTTEYKKMRLSNKLYAGEVLTCFLRTTNNS